MARSRRGHAVTGLIGIAITAVWVWLCALYIGRHAGTEGLATWSLPEFAALIGGAGMPLIVLWVMLF